MFRKFAITFAVSATLSFTFAGCGSSDSECIVCDGPAGGAVRCHLGLFTYQDICAVDQNTAGIHCIAAGGEWEILEICYEGGETGDGDPFGQPWEPGKDIKFDSKTNTYIIDQIAFENFKLDSSAIFSDNSELREHSSGYYQVVMSGELTTALGWETGDILLDIDGYELLGLSGFTDAYAELARNSKFELTLLRGVDEVVLSYRVQ